MCYCVGRVDYTRYTVATGTSVATEAICKSWDLGASLPGYMEPTHRPGHAWGREGVGAMPSYCIYYYYI